MPHPETLDANGGGGPLSAGVQETEREPRNRKEVASRAVLRAAAVAQVLLLAAFFALMGTAMAHYPGGTWEEPGAIGHRIVWNYFCDLMRPVALNGTPNPVGAALAPLGLLALALALVPFFLTAPTCFPERPRLGRFVRVAGVVCGVGGALSVAVPSHRFGALAHGLALLLAAVPALAAGVASALGVWTARPPSAGLRASSAGTLALTAACAAIFARQLALRAETTPGLALLQKLAVLCLAAWLLLTSARALRLKPTTSGRARPSAPPR